MRPNVRRSTLQQLTRLHERVTALDITDRSRWRRSIELGVRLALAGEVELWEKWSDDLELLFEIVIEDQGEPLGDAIGAVCIADDVEFAPAAIRLAEYLEAVGEAWFARSVLEEVRFRLHATADDLKELHRAGAGGVLGNLLVKMSVTGSEPVDLLVESAGTFEQHGFFVSAGRLWAQAAAVLQGSDDVLAMEYLEEAERNFGRGGAVEAERQARLDRALLLGAAGHGAQAVDLALATATGPLERLRALQLHALATAYRSLGLHPQALAAATEAEVSYEEVGDTEKATELAQFCAGITAEFGSASELWFE